MRYVYMLVDMVPGNVGSTQGTAGVAWSCVETSSVFCALLSAFPDSRAGHGPVMYTVRHVTTSTPGFKLATQVVAAS